MSMSKKITILIDADPAAQPNTSGVGYYTKQLIKELSMVDPDNVEIVGHYFNFLGRNKPDLYHSNNTRYVVSRFVPRQIMNSFRRNKIPFPFEILTRVKPDFIIYANFLSRYNLFNTPYAPIIHDFTYIDHPEYMSNKNQNDLQNLIPITLNNASFAITISKTSKKYLLQHYPDFKKPVIAELLSVKKDSDDANSRIDLKKLGITKPYILFVGNIEPRKNLKGAIRAYSQLTESIRSKYSLVIVGGNSWGESLKKDFPSIENNKDILFTGYVDDRVKSALYRNSKLFLFPSFYEGYGMPIIEAMQFGIPVAISNTNIHKEVAGDAAMYFNPSDPNDIARNIEAILSSVSLQKKLIRNSKDVIKTIESTNFAKILIDQIRKNIM